MKIETSIYGIFPLFGLILSISIIIGCTDNTHVAKAESSYVKTYTIEKKES